jgi:hypothetical protein
MRLSGYTFMFSFLYSVLTSAWYSLSNPSFPVVPAILPQFQMTVNDLPSSGNGL